LRWEAILSSHNSGFSVQLLSFSSLTPETPRFVACDSEMRISKEA
jgi:hypothetical protein